MPEKWAACTLLAICLALVAGCRSTQPELKPTPAAERFVDPPMEARYETAAYPKAAFSPLEDPTRRLTETKNGSVIPTRGSMMPGMGGMGGYR